MSFISNRLELMHTRSAKTLIRLRASESSLVALGSTKFVFLINLKLLTIANSLLNIILKRQLLLAFFIFIRHKDFMFSGLEHESKFYNLGARYAITKTRLYKFDPLEPHFYIVKLGFTGVYIIFLISAQNIDCGYSLEPPRRGGSDEYPQSMF